MSTITIEPAGRNIHDLADNYPITIDMGARYQYAVAAPAYYRIAPTRHMTLHAALKRARALRNYEGVTIIDRDGRDGRPDHCAGEWLVDWQVERDNCITVDDA